jgi:hypothetical protein
MDCYEATVCPGKCEGCPSEATRGNLVRFAEAELKRAGLYDEDSDYAGELGRSVLRIARTFAQQRFSGFAAGQAALMLERLTRFRPLQPLTADPDEWMKITNLPPCWQSRRRSDAFSPDGGETYYLLDDSWPWYRRWLGLGRRMHTSAPARKAVGA